MMTSQSLMQKQFLVLLSGAVAFAFLTPSSHAGAVVFSDAGTATAEIQDTIDAFRVAASETGSTPVDNGVGGGLYVNGLRHLDWDVVPSGLATPSSLPANYFKNDVPVGVGLSTLGTGLRVSAVTGESVLPAFGDVQPSYQAQFAAYGDHRMFAPINSTVTDIRFFVPGEPGTPAAVSAFGAIFMNVHTPKGELHPSMVEYWDISGQLLGYYLVPPSEEGVSFLGVRFDGGEQVARVRINSGNIPLIGGADDGAGDVANMVSMGQFFYSEPLSIPEPRSSMLLVVGGLAVWLASARRRGARA